VGEGDKYSDLPAASPVMASWTFWDSPEMLLWAEGLRPAERLPYQLSVLDQMGSVLGVDVLGALSLDLLDKGAQEVDNHLDLAAVEGSPILVVGIYRPFEVALGRDGASPGSGQRERHPLEPVIDELQRHFGQIHVDLRQSADRQSVEALLDTESNCLDSEFRQSFYQQTRCHALFTVEMLRGMQERGDLVDDEAGRWVEGPEVDWETLPARVEGIIAERINRLPAALQKVLKVASVEGEGFAAEVVAQVRGAGEPETIEQLSGELATQHRLLRGRGRTCLLARSRWESAGTAIRGL
jgi:hypothetical protein